MANVVRSRLIRPLEAAALLITAVIFAGFGHALNAFEHFTRFLAEHEAWELDEFVLVFLSYGLGAMALVVRRGTQAERAEARRQKKGPQKRPQVADEQSPSPPVPD